MLFFWLVGFGCIDYILYYSITKLKYQRNIGSLQSKAAQIPQARNGQKGIIVIVETSSVSELHVQISDSSLVVVGTVFHWRDQFSWEFHDFSEISVSLFLWGVRLRYDTNMSTIPMILPMMYAKKSQSQAIFAPAINPINIAILKSPPPIHRSFEITICK